MSREEIYAEVEKGTQIAARLKNIFYKDVPWNAQLGFVEIPEKLNFLKKVLRNYYPGKSNTEIFRIAASYSEQDILDIFCVKVD